MDAIKTLKTALTHAEFKDPDIKTATDVLLDKLSDELNAAGYDAGSEVEDAAATVETAITTYEESLEATPATAGAGADDDEDDEFAGLGADDDEDIPRK